MRRRVFIVCLFACQGGMLFGVRPLPMHHIQSSGTMQSLCFHLASACVRLS